MPADLRTPGEEYPHLRRLRSAGVVALALLALTEQAGAQEPRPIPRLSGPIQLDGRVDEAAWEAIAPLPSVMSSPDFGHAPSERTELRLGHDDRYLYASGRLFDRDPSRIVATSLKRDETSMSNDWFVVNLDTFRDRETTLVFATNPAGIRTEGVMANDGVQWNGTWNAVWDAAVSQDAGGWYAEVRIPLSSLRFETVDRQVVMGATISRWIARKSESISWPGIRHDWGTNSIYKASQMADIELTGVSRENPIQVVPYVLGGVARSAALLPDRSDYQLRSSRAREPGLDVKITPTNSLTLDLTVNTDFAQVEADDQQVNLTRFSLFFPERRLFFQERAGVFEYSLGDNQQLFYSRQIGLKDGTPVRIYGGARAVGRTNGWDIGVLDMHTEGSQGAASENNGVVRVKRQLFNENSYVGGIATTRLGADGRNVTIGADALVRVLGQDYLTVNLAQTRDRGDSLSGEPDRWLARARWERRGLYGPVYTAEAARVGGEFLPALGFLSRRDYARGSLKLGWGWRGAEGVAVLRYSLTASGNSYRSLGRGRTETADAGLEWLVEGRRGRMITLTVTGRYDDLEAPFSLGGGVSVPASLYRFVEVSVKHDAPRSSPLRLNSQVTVGTFYDGRRLSASVTPTWNASVHWQLSGSYQYNRIAFAERGQELASHLARVRALWMLNSSTAITGLVQYNTASDALVLNLRLRYNPREGNDFYLVYNHGLNTDRFGYSPTRELTDNQALLLKYSHTLTLGW